MVKHIILWKLKDFTENERTDIMQGAKTALEALNGKIPGLISISLRTKCLDSSNSDMMLVSVFEDEESLKNYQTHPLHTAAADTYVRPFTAERLCMDFKE